MNKLVEAYVVEEIAEYLKLHPYTVRRLAREGKIPAFRAGGQWRFRKDEIDKSFRQFRMLCTFGDSHPLNLQVVSFLKNQSFETLCILVFHVICRARGIAQYHRRFTAGKHTICGVPSFSNSEEIGQKPVPVFCISIPVDRKGPQEKT